MIKHWHDLKRGEGAPKEVNVLIEIQKGSNIKYEIDKEHGGIKLDRFLYSSMYYPGDYGFIPQTYGGDNDALDMFVYTNWGILPGTIAAVRPIGAMTMTDSGERDDKIIGVYSMDPRLNEIREINDLPKHVIKEIKYFFENYKTLENKKVEVLRVLNQKDALGLIVRGIEDYDKKFKKQK